MIFLLLISLASFLVSPKIVLADDFENITSEELSKYLELPEKDANKLMDTLRQVFTTEGILSWSSGEVSDEETSIAVTLQKVVTIQALSHLLVDAPLEIIQDIIKAAVNIVQIYITPEVFWEKFEKLTVEKAIEEGKKQLFQNEIRVTPGAIEFEYYSYKGEEKKITLQYVMIYKPEGEKRARVVIRFYMPNSIEAPASKKKGDITTLNVPELKKDLPPFIVEISGRVEKDEFGNYWWIDENGKRVTEGPEPTLIQPAVKITFPPEVPDLGIKPLSLWEKYLLKPIETTINEIDIIITKVTGKSLNLVGIWDKIKSFFSEINPPAPAALIETPLPEEEEPSVEVGQEIGQEIFPSVEVPNVEVNPQQPQQPEPKQLTLEEMQEMLDDIAERIDILSQGVAELMAKSQSISEEIEEPEEELKEEEEKLEKVPEQKLCEKISWSYPLRNKIIINEVAWMGTTNSANDEWIELKNISGSPIDLTGWQLLDKDNQIKIIFYRGLTPVKISAGGVLLLERTNDETVPGVAADLIYTGGLSNTNEALYLFDENCQLQDEVLANPNWPAGDNSSKRTMERKTDLAWQTSANPGGTPKRENSGGYVEGGGGTPALPPPILEVSTTPLSFEAIEDVKAPASQFLIIGNSGGSNLNWQISPSESWLNFDPSEGSISPHSSSTIKVSVVDINEFATGSTSTTFRVEATGAQGSPKQISVNLNIYEKRFAKNVVISEIRASGQEEFVELYNPTAEDINMSNWYFSYFSSGNDWNSPWLSKQFLATSTIASSSYFLIALGDYPEVNGNPDPDWKPYKINLSDEAGSIGIFSCDPKSASTLEEAIACKIDLVGWDKKNEISVKEREAATPSQTGESLGRKIAVDDEGNLNYLDLDNNRLDFGIQNPTPGKQNENLPPIAKFDFFPENPYVGDNILFDASGSSDPDGNISLFIWDFGGEEISTTTSQITKFFSTSSTSTISLSVIDDSGATSTPTSTQIFVKSREKFSVVINEIAWMGTKASSSDEWIEFYNPTSSEDIDIINWSIFGAKTRDCLNFSEADGIATTTISLGGYLIYAKRQEVVKNEAGQSIVDIWDDEIEMSDDLPGQLTLYDVPNCQGGDLIDVVGEVNGEWFAGNATDSISMERISATTTGATSTNWANNNLITRNGKDAAGKNINGTPKAKNSVSVSPTTISILPFDEFPEITLTYLGSPYIIKTNLVVPAANTLKIEPGVGLKFYMPPSYGPNEGAYLYVYGTLMALGESGKEIVFTVSEEGGPYWPGIIFKADNPETTISSQLEYVRIEKARSWENPYFASVKVDKKLISIKNSIIENFQIGETWAANTGLVLKNSYSTVDKVTFLNYKNPDHLNYSSDSATAIRIEGGAPIIKNSKFQGNWIGIILQTTETCLSNPNFEISKNDFQQNQVPIFLINYGMPCFSQNQATTSGIDNYGNELNGILVGDIIFSKDTLWSADLPYIVRGVTIQNSTATIAAGTKIKFRYSSGIGETGYLRVENSGRLICQGEPDNYILFTSARQNPQPGNWQSIWFKAPSSGILRYVEIEYGGWNFPEKGVLKIDSGAEVVQENVVIDSTKNILP